MQGLRCYTTGRAYATIPQAPCSSYLGTSCSSSCIAAKASSTFRREEAVGGRGTRATSSQKAGIGEQITVCCPVFLSRRLPPGRQLLQPRARSWRAHSAQAEAVKLASSHGRPTWNAWELNRTLYCIHSCMSSPCGLVDCACSAMQLARHHEAQRCQGPG